MMPATVSTQRPADAKLLVVDGAGAIEHWRRADVVRLFQPGDLVIANDAATLPASLTGRHLASGRSIEARLAGCGSLALDRVKNMTAVLFGLGDFRMPTERRPPPPAVRAGDRLALGPLRATVSHHLMNHPRVVALSFDGALREIWAGLARHGRPIQYSHLPAPLALSDVWTPIAGLPAAFEPPSASFALDWRTVAAIRARGVRFATLTHVAGISSTGDSGLDALLPFDEPYRIPAVTADAIRAARDHGGRIVAIGTTVLRALEHAGGVDGIVRAGDGLATQRIDATTPLRVVDAIVSGTHERGTSHFDLLRACAGDQLLGRIEQEWNANGYRTHEFGDSVFIERRRSGLLATGVTRKIA
jgi:S-adenosylmethionine:tRNA ribosyltransferase-isomerase